MSKNIKNIIKYFVIDASIGNGHKKICLQSTEIPTKENLLIFLNNIYSVNMYQSIIDCKEISKDTAESYRYDKELFYITNMFEVCCITPDNTETMFCITGIDTPTLSDALKTINICMTYSNKIKSVKWIKPITIKEAVQQYDMEYWTKPWDLYDLTEF